MTEKTYEELFDSFLNGNKKEAESELSDKKELSEEDNEEKVEAPPQEDNKEKDDKGLPEGSSSKEEDDYSDLLDSAEDEATKQKLQKLIQSERSQRGRVAAFQKKLSTLQSYHDNARAPQASEQKAETKKASAAEPAKSTDKELSPELAALKEKYPSIYDAIVKVSQTQWEERERDLEAKLNEKIQPLTETQQKQKWAEEAKRLEEQASELFDTENTNITVRDVIASKDFSDWFNGQPEKTKLLYRNATSAEEVMLILTKFDRDHQYMTKLNQQIAEETPKEDKVPSSSNKGDELKARREKVKKESVTPPTKTPAGGGLDTDDYDSLFDHYWGDNGKYRTNRRF